MNTSPVISVIIPTCNRVRLLADALESMKAQSLDQRDFEVVVVDDGSTDTTSLLCEKFARSMDLKYFQLDHAGTASAKNLGIFASSGAISLIFDDDDIADCHLLEAHIASHERHPEEEVAVLGYTTWAPSLTITEVMRYITDIGQYLFAYQNLRDGQLLDFTHFWAGRISLKRSFLTRRAIFNQDMHWPSYEDIELGFRLSRYQLKIVYDRSAMSYMNRSITYDAFCRRCEGQGASQFLLSRMHPEPVVEEHCRVPNARQEWERLCHSLAGMIARVHELERMVEDEQESRSVEEVRIELHSLYRTTFHAFRVKGFIDASQALEVGNAAV